MITKRIWLYWENKYGCSRPKYLDLALETILCHSGSYEVVLLNEKSVQDYIKIPHTLKRFSEIAHKADYIRFNLLHKYGGVWLDSDLILLRNIDEAIEPFISDYDYVGYGREQGKPSIGFMACIKGCRLLGIQLEEVNKVLRRKRWTRLPFKKLELGWNELGYDIFWRIAKNYDYYHHERNMFAPTVWSEWEYFYRTDVDVDDYLSHNPFGVVLYNKLMFDLLKDVSTESLVNGNTLLSKLFRKGIEVA